MARWKLMCPHYLNLADGTEWEYIEISGGKQRRNRYNVPRLLDPREPGDWNQRWGQSNTQFVIGNEEGIIVVAFPGQGVANDYEFLGDPTPDMMPIDDEAKEISESFTARWSYRPDGADQSFSQSLIDAIDELKSAPRTETIQIAGLDQLMASMAQTQATLAGLATALATDHSVRRI